MPLAGWVRQGWLRVAGLQGCSDASPVVKGVLVAVEEWVGAAVIASARFSHPVGVQLCLASVSLLRTQQE